MNTEKTAPVSLTPEEGRCLVRLARLTIADRLKCPVPEQERQSVETALRRPVFAHRCGTFVTLKKEGHLRGCIGSLVVGTTLRENVRQNAINAAFQDPRFPPLTREELDHVDIEVSVLTPPEALSYATSDELIERLRPGTDGVILRKGHASATFLPQVWNQLPRRQDFLAHLCLKAGLAAQAWRKGDVEIETYHVQYFEEARDESG